MPASATRKTCECLDELSCPVVRSHLEGFRDTLRRKHFSLVSPQKPSSGDECEKAPHLVYFSQAPIQDDIDRIPSPPTDRDSSRPHKYLWIICEKGVPYCKETTGHIAYKHTNITRCGEAFCGGEVWFRDESSLYLNGGSGRYPCENNEVLMTYVIEFFRRIGYKVAVPPVDEDTGWRPRVFKGEMMVDWGSADDGTA